MTNTPRNLWMGVGISNTYLRAIPQLGEELSKMVEDNRLGKIRVIIADSMDQQYNGRQSKELIYNIYRELGIWLPSNRVIYSSGFYSEFESFQRVLRKLRRLYSRNKDFRTEVNSLVKDNRGKNIDIEHSAGYVLEELTFIQLFANRGEQKIGPLESEIRFDRLAIDFLGISQENFHYFTGVFNPKEK